MAPFPPRRWLLPCSGRASTASADWGATGPIEAMLGHPALNGLTGLINAGMQSVSSSSSAFGTQPALPASGKFTPDAEERPHVAEADQLREDLQKMTDAALKAQKDGDHEGSKFKTMLAEEIRDKLKEVEARDTQAAKATVATVAGAACQQDLSQVPPPLPPPMPRLPPPMPRPPGTQVALPGMSGNFPPFARPLGMPPPPGFGGGGLQDWQRMMTLYQNPELATNITQQQAMQYEEEKSKSTKLEPEVIELAHHFNLTDRHARLLDEQLKKRNNTFDDDVAAMYEILKGAKNPADLLMVSVRWMAEGVFNGTRTPNADVEKIAKKYKLDAPSACKLAEVLESRNDPEVDLKRICSHLERSNRPSALVMMMLRDLKSGNPVEESTKTPSIGSYLHLKETKRATQRGARSRSRERA
eukprot:CAMPEP_0172686704 /NCGR_PEP_ID=MMETSP1074-20121228/21125_1 /TAXON_ID=2916 /ORGANISM="Ceratium fusus, Strain PA161109" /LENGTH=414 /DNA_ID=CAMNT_0013506049 /DNA_START=8 /DNA_END=1250 /DNA_ORIENTATION=-